MPIMNNIDFVMFLEIYVHIIREFMPKLSSLFPLNMFIILAFTLLCCVI